MAGAWQPFLGPFLWNAPCGGRMRGRVRLPPSAITAMPAGGCSGSLDTVPISGRLVLSSPNHPAAPFGWGCLGWGFSGRGELSLTSSISVDSSSSPFQKYLDLKEKKHQQIWPCVQTWCFPCLMLSARGHSFTRSITGPHSLLCM